MTKGFNPIRTLRAAAAAAALGLSAATRLAADPVPAPARLDATPLTVSVVSQKGGAYRIEGSFQVAAPAPLAWAVLTDYDNLPSFVSSMKSSTVARDGTGRLLVTQAAVGRVGPFSRTLNVVLDVTEAAPARIAFRDVCGESFHSYAGSWTIDAERSGVRVTYVLEAWPLSSPPLFARSILAANARGLLDQVRLEMQRRDRVASAY